MMHIYDSDSPQSSIEQKEGKPCKKLFIYLSKDFPQVSAGSFVIGNEIFRNHRFHMVL